MNRRLIALYTLFSLAALNAIILFIDDYLWKLRLSLTICVLLSFAYTISIWQLKIDSNPTWYTSVILHFCISIFMLLGCIATYLISNEIALSWQIGIAGISLLPTVQLISYMLADSKSKSKVEKE